MAFGRSNMFSTLTTPTGCSPSPLLPTGIETCATNAARQEEPHPHLIPVERITIGLSRARMLPHGTASGSGEGATPTGAVPAAPVDRALGHENPTWGIGTSTAARRTRQPGAAGPRPRSKASARTWPSPSPASGLTYKVYINGVFPMSRPTPRGSSTTSPPASGRRGTRSGRGGLRAVRRRPLGRRPPRLPHFPRGASRPLRSPTVPLRRTRRAALPRRGSDLARRPQRGQQRQAVRDNTDEI